MAEYRGGRPRTSPVWDHFEIKDPELCTATCNHCQDVFSYRTSVSNLLKHLKHKHNYKGGDDVFTTEPVEDKSIKCKTLRSEVWDYFEIKDDDAKLAVCNLCSEQFSYRTTSANLGKHLKRSHGVHFKRTDEDEEMEVEKLESDEEEADVDKIETVTVNESHGRARSSIAWEHFTVQNARTRVAQCNLCGTMCSYRTSVSNLMKHVRRKHGIDVICKSDDGDDDGSDVEVHKTPRNQSMIRAHRSIVWLYFKCVDSESKLSQCLICKKLLCHSTTLTNLKKHLARKHPNVKIPDTRQDGTKRVLLSSGGELYEIETSDIKEDLHDNDENQHDTVEMDTIYLDDFDALDQEPKDTKPQLTKTSSQNNRKRANNAYDISSDEEVTFLNKYAKKQCDSLDYFGRYMASLLRQLPNQIANQLQTDFVKQIMNAQLTYETQKSQVTDTESNAYSITITAQDTDPVTQSDAKHDDVLENIVGNTGV